MVDLLHLEIKPKFTLAQHHWQVLAFETIFCPTG